MLHSSLITQVKAHRYESTLVHNHELRSSLAVSPSNIARTFRRKHFKSTQDSYKQIFTKGLDPGSYGGKHCKINLAMVMSRQTPPDTLLVKLYWSTRRETCLMESNSWMCKKESVPLSLAGVTYIGQAIC